MSDAGVPAQVVRTALDASPGDEIHLVSEYFLQLRFHVVQLEQAVSGALRKADQHVDVTARAEVVAQHRSEKRELDNLPAAAEVPKLLGRDGQGIVQRCSLHCWLSLPVQASLSDWNDTRLQLGPTTRAIVG